MLLSDKIEPTLSDSAQIAYEAGLRAFALRPPPGFCFKTPQVGTKTKRLSSPDQHQLCHSPTRLDRT
jgi:hypothetical protein